MGLKYYGNGYWGPDTEAGKKGYEKNRAGQPKSGNAGQWLKNTYDTLFNGGANQISESNRVAQEKMNAANIASQERMNAANISMQKEANKLNLDFANKNFEYQKQLNNQTMEREDTAVRRSIADYQAAGLNKLLAVGQSAPTSTMQTAGGSAEQQISRSESARQEAFIRNSQNMSVLDMALNTAGKVNELANSKTQRELINKQIAGQQIVNDWNRIKKLREDYARETDKEQRKLIKKQIEALTHDLNIAMESGRPVGVDNKASNLWSFIDKIVSGVQNNTSKSGGVVGGIGKVLKFLGF